MKPARKPRTPFTDDRKRKFLDAYANGLTIAHAAAKAGVSRATVYYTEINDDEFAAQLDKLRDAHFENQRDILLARIMDAAKKNWQAAAWILERHYPDQYGKPAPRDYKAAQAPYFVVESTTIGRTANGQNHGQN